MTSADIYLWEAELWHRELFHNTQAWTEEQCQFRMWHYLLLWAMSEQESK